MPRRFLFVWLPRLATDVVERRGEHGRRGERALAVVVSGGRGVMLVAVNRAAAGLGPGLTLADARAVVPEVVAVEAEPGAGARALEGLADWAGRYTPGVARAMALGLEGTTVAALERVGLRRIGDLYPLPRRALAGRFGLEVGCRLERALGRENEPFSPRRPVVPHRARLDFAEPTGRCRLRPAATTRHHRNQPTGADAGGACGRAAWRHAAYFGWGLERR